MQIEQVRMDSVGKDTFEPSSYATSERRLTTLGEPKGQKLAWINEVSFSIDMHFLKRGGEYHPIADKLMVIGNEVTRIITLGKWSISQVVNQDETSEKSGNIRARLIQKQLRHVVMTWICWRNHGKTEDKAVSSNTDVINTVPKPMYKWNTIPWRNQLIAELKRMAETLD